MFIKFPVLKKSEAIKCSLPNSTWRIGAHPVHQWAYLWWSSINFGGPKRYMYICNNQNALIMVSQGNAAWTTTEKKTFVLNATFKNQENLNHQTVLNFETCLEQYFGNGNLKKPRTNCCLSDHHRQLFCQTDAVFAGLGQWSSRLFRRLKMMGI